MKKNIILNLLITLFLCVNIIVLIYLKDVGFKFYENNNIVSFFLLLLSEGIVYIEAFLLSVVILIIYIIVMKNMKRKMLVSLIILFVLIDLFKFTIYLKSNKTYELYKINNKNICNIEIYANVLKDIWKGETIEIKSADVKLQSFSRIFKSRLFSRPSNRRYSSIQAGKDYYLSIDDEKYIIPIGDEKNKIKVKKLLWLNRYEDNSIDTITVYKNSKLIKAINGIELSSKEEEIDELAKIKIKEYMKSEGINDNLYKRILIEYEVDGASS